MASKKQSKVTETTAPAAAPSGLSAIAALKAAVSEPVVSATAGSMAIAAEMSDPAIAGASRKNKSSVVTLGADPKILSVAAEAAEIRVQMAKLTTLFQSKESQLRDYGKEKRKAYNKLFRTDITTVSVPYSVEVPRTDDSATPGRETRYVQVICSNKYSVAAEPIIKGDEALGEWKGKLFNFETTKVLKPNAEEIIRNVLSESGIQGEALDKAMNLLLEEKTKVSTVEDYERLEQDAPEPVRAFLAQTVTRQQPGLKFPNEEV